MHGCIVQLYRRIHIEGHDTGEYKDDVPLCYATRPVGLLGRRCACFSSWLAPPAVCISIYSVQNSAVQLKALLLRAHAHQWRRRPGSWPPSSRGGTVQAACSGHAASPQLLGQPLHTHSSAGLGAHSWSWRLPKKPIVAERVPRVLLCAAQCTIPLAHLKDSQIRTRASMVAIRHHWHTNMILMSALTVVTTT